MRDAPELPPGGAKLRQPSRAGRDLAIGFLGTNPGVDQSMGAGHPSSTRRLFS
jgi:hypothetical protein